MDIGEMISRGLMGGNKNDSSSDGGGDDFRNSESHANAKDLLEWALTGSGKLIAVIHKLLLGPLGISLGKFGRISLAKALGGDTEGLASKTIIPSIAPNMAGGKLAEIMYNIIKNLKIENLAQGIEKLSWIDMPMAALGSLSPPPIGVTTHEQGHGHGH